MVQYFPALVILALLILLALLRRIDRQHQQHISTLPPLSVIIPCYNNLDSIEQTIATVYAVCGADVDLIVADDCSSDGSRDLLAQLQRRYGFTLTLNDSNQGKAWTLNEQYPLARHDILLFIDADTLVNQAALLDALGRLQNPRVGAVSCPYVPLNGGLIPLMQHIEYNMLAFFQGASNAISVLALWGGCIVIRRQAFAAVAGFSRNTITEDMDLSYKLNAIGWKVQQAQRQVQTLVPDTLRGWLKQKMRWTSGGFQCLVTHYRVWLRHPLHLLFMGALLTLLSLSVLELADDLMLWDRIFEYFTYQKTSAGILMSLKLTYLRYGLLLTNEALLGLSFTLFSLPFVWPLVSSLKQAHLLLLVIPFSFCYLPAFSLISLVGAICFLRRKQELDEKACRAW